MPKSDATYEGSDGLEAASWLRTAVLPAVVFVVAVAVVCGLVLGGVVQGHKTYAPSAAPTTTRPTVLIEP